MAKIRLLMAGILMFLSITSVGADSNNGNGIPWIYYFSKENSEFIIERADGAEGRILASYNDSFEEEFDVLGPGWSPSGIWLAWYIPLLETNKGIHFISIDGKKRDLTFDDEGFTERAIWSPEADSLLILRYFNQVHYLYKYAIDTDSLELIGQADLLTNTEDDTIFYHIGWSPDGNRISMAYDRHDKATGSYNDILRVVTSKDTLEFVGECRHSACVGGDLPHWLENNVIAYARSNEELVILDLSTNSETKVPIPSNIVTIDWSPHGRKALLYTQSGLNTLEFNLWVVSLEQQRSIQIAEDVKLPNIDLPHFPASYWSPNGTLAYFILNNGDLGIYNTMDTQTFTAISGYEPELISPSPKWWSPNSETLLLFMEQSGSRNIFEYDVDLDEVIPLFEGGVTEGRYLSAKHNDLIAFGGKVWNLETGTSGEELRVVTSYYDNQDYETREIIWHSKDNWLFLLGYISDTYRAVNISNASNTIQRDIGTCLLVDNKSCFGWLPEKN